MIIIGITGTLGSGKGTVVKYLKDKHGFKHYSSSGFINEEVIRRGLPVNRDNQRIVANELRATHGGGYVAEQLYARAAAAGGNSVIESLRSTGEIETLRKLDQPFYLLAVDADQKTRYDRIIQRGSEKDNISFEHFQEQEEKELNDTKAGGIRLLACIEMADAHVENNGDLEALHKQIDNIIAPLLS